MPPARVRVSPPATAFVVPVSASRFQEVTIAAVDTAVTSPLALTVITGIAVVVPKLPTLLLTVARVETKPTTADPLKATLGAVISPDTEKFLAVARVVAVLALPVSAPVIVPAVKFPEPSRRTSLLAVFDAVAPVIISV